MHILIMMGLLMWAKTLRILTVSVPLPLVDCPEATLAYEGADLVVPVLR